MEKLYGNFKKVVPSPANGHAKTDTDGICSCQLCTSNGTPTFHSYCCEENHSPFSEVQVGSYLYPFNNGRFESSQKKAARKCYFGRVVDPRSKQVQTWNRCFLLSRCLALAIDPLFFYVVSVQRRNQCIYLDGLFAILVTTLRTIGDAMHLAHMWLQLRLAYVSKESLVIGRGKLEWDAHKIAMHYLHPSGGFLFDLFVMLPVPQVLFWVVLPNMIKKGQVTSIMIIALVSFMLQYVPKICHVVGSVRRMQHVTGYIFGTVWWAFILNLKAYFIASHVAGACWYLLASQQVSLCLHKERSQIEGYNSRYLGCVHPIVYRNNLFNDESSLFGLLNSEIPSACFDVRSEDNNRYGIYRWAVPLITGYGWSNKIAYPIFWGLMTLSSFGNALQPSNHTLEVGFSIVVITCGLILFVLLIGNIQVILHSITAKKEDMKIKLRDLEWWMRRRQLPHHLRRRTRQYERQRWAAMRGIDEMKIVQDLPEGLRHDVNRHLCLDLVRQVPLFQQMDNVVLDNICDRVKPVLLIKGESVVREGDPVKKMLFIVRGHFQIIHRLSNGQTSSCKLGPGNFSGEELLSWCLRRPFIDRLPTSSATLITLNSTEAFGLEAMDLKYVTEHFRSSFVSEKLKRTSQYYSSNWRTWAAVTIQLSWRSHKARTAIGHNQNMHANNTSRTSSGGLSMLQLARSQTESDRLRLFAAMFTSPKPQNHLE